MNKRYAPKVDKLFFMLFIPTTLLVLGLLVIPTILELKMLFFSVPIFLFVEYFFVSPLFGYVELRESELFIKYGFFLRKSIPYQKLRSLKIDRKFYSESMMALKNAFEHVNIRYNTFDVTVVSVKDNAAFVADLETKMKA